MYGIRNYVNVVNIAKAKAKIYKLFKNQHKKNAISQRL